MNQLKIGWKRCSGCFLEVTEDSDVARVADLLRQVGRVVDELRTEEGVLLLAFQEAEVDGDAELFEGLVDKAGMARLVAGHVTHQVGDLRVIDVFA
jgi:hypothetical protein